jgi:cytoskeletal protein CcmA (bactofilin family)
MSTFSRDNSPDDFSGGNAQIMKLIRELQQELTAQKQAYEKYTDELTTKRLNVTGAPIPPDMQNSAPSTTLKNGLKVEGATVVEGLTTGNERVVGTLDVGEKFTAEKDAEFKKQVRILADLDVNNIFAGPMLDFDKPTNITLTCNHYYSVAKLNQHEGKDKPGIVFIHSTGNPALTALIQFTDYELIAVYSRPTSISTLKFGLYHDANGTYLCMYAEGATPGAGSTLAGGTYWASTINATLQTQPVTIDVSTIRAEVACVGHPNSKDSSITSGIALTHLDVGSSHITNAEIDNLDVKNLNATGGVAFDGDLAVGGKMSADSLEVDKDATIKGNAAITGNETVGGNLEVTGDVEAASIAADSVKTDNLNDSAGHSLVQVDEAGDLVNVGATLHELNIRSKARPTWNLTESFAMMKDLTNSIIFEGVADYFGYDLSDLPTGAYPVNAIEAADTSGATWTGALVTGETALVIPLTATTDAETKLYSWSGASWTDEGSLTISLEALYAYEFHVSWVKEGTDTYWHEASVLWAPNSDASITSKVSIINLPLENYYDMDQVNALFEAVWYMLAGGREKDYDPVTVPPLLRPVIMADWLDNDREVVNPVSGDTVPNPGFIQNKPLTGFSFLDGGDWGASSVVAFDYVIDGGSFDNVTDSAITGSISAEAAGARATYPHVLYRIYHGESASMPPASANTQWCLKYCTDTKNLWLDSGDATQPDSPFVKSGNILLTSPPAKDVVAWFRLVGDANPSTNTVTVKHLQQHGDVFTTISLPIASGNLSLDNEDRVTFTGTKPATPPDPDALPTEPNQFTSLNVVINVDDIIDRLDHGVFDELSTSQAGTNAVGVTLQPYNLKSQAAGTAVSFVIQVGDGMEISVDANSLISLSFVPTALSPAQYVELVSGLIGNGLIGEVLSNMDAAQQQALADALAPLMPVTPPPTPNYTLAAPITSGGSPSGAGFVTCVVTDPSGTVVINGVNLLTSAGQITMLPVKATDVITFTGAGTSVTYYPVA